MVADGVAPFCRAHTDDVSLAIREDGGDEMLRRIVALYGKMSSSNMDWAKSRALIVGKCQKEKNKPTVSACIGHKCNQVPRSSLGG